MVVPPELSAVSRLVDGPPSRQRSGMSTIRVAKRNRFTTIDRRAVNDERLSYRARGILAWLLDKPDDWSATRETIAAASPEGVTAVRSALKELSDLGYLVRTKVRLPSGRTVTETVIHEVPPEVGYQPAVNQPAVRPPAIDLRLEPTTETETPLATPKKAKPLAQASPEANRLALAEWERRQRKPVCGFAALRARIQDVLDAGHPTEAIERALPTMDVFSRNSFDLALGRQTPSSTTPRLSKSRQNSDRVFERMLANERDRSESDDRLGGRELAPGDH